jgi:hypothetical protein
LAATLPDGAQICLMADRFLSGGAAKEPLGEAQGDDTLNHTPGLISFCQNKNWDYRIRLKGNLTVRDGDARMTAGDLAKNRIFALENVQLTAKLAETSIGVIHDPGHEEPWIIAMPVTPGYMKTLEYSNRWAIEPMFSDFKSRGFGLENTQIQYPDRLSRLILVMALALIFAASTGRWDALANPLPAEKKADKPAKKARTLKNVLLHTGAALHREGYM